MDRIRLYYRLYFFLFIFALSLCQELHTLEFQSGLGMGTQIHYSKNTFRCAPGAAFHFSTSLHPRFDLNFRLFAGAFFGYSILLESGFFYYFREDGYRPGIGVCINLDFGSVIFHTESSENIIYPTYPEAGFCIAVKPANFRFSRVTLSFIDISAGTDLNFPNCPPMVHLLRGDHAPFWQKGIPAIMVTDTAFLRDGHPYHTEEDTIDKIDFTFMFLCVRASIATLCIESDIQ